MDVMTISMKIAYTFPVLAPLHGVYVKNDGDSVNNSLGSMESGQNLIPLGVVMDCECLRLPATDKS